MKLRALSKGSGIEEILEKERRGIVFAVFDKSILLVMKCALITLVRRDLYNGVTNIVLNLSPDKTMKSLGVKVGMRVNFTSNYLKIEPISLVIDMRAAKEWNWKLNKLPKADFRGGNTLTIYAEKLCVKIRIALQQMNANSKMHLPYLQGLIQQTDLNPDIGLRKARLHETLYDVALKQRICNNVVELTGAVREHSLANVKRVASKLVGLGLGLTPSCDDILAGFMLGYFYSCRVFFGKVNYPLKVNEKIVEALQISKTSIPAIKMLEYAAKGLSSEVVENTLAAILITKCGEKEVQKSVNSLLQVGASSGIDLMVGILIGINEGINCYEQTSKRVV